MTDSDPRKTKRFAIWPWVLGLPLLLAMVVMIVLAVFFSSKANRRLAAATAAADRDDPYWRLVDLMAHRETVPDKENSALVLAELRSIVPKNWPSISPPSASGLPRRKPELKSIYDSISSTPDNVRMDESSAAAMRADLTQYSEAIGKARSVANYPRGRHEIQLEPAVIDTLLPETEAARSVARLLQADAAIRAHDGDLDGAIDSCRALLNTGRSIGDEPFIISQLVRVAIGKTAMMAACRALGQGEPSDAALGRLQTLIVDEAAQPLLLHSVRGERATMTDLIHKIASGKVPLSKVIGGSPESGGVARNFAVQGMMLFAGSQEAVAIEWMNDAVAIARRPTPEQTPLWDGWNANVISVRGSNFGRFTAALPLLLAPALSSARETFNRYQADLGATAILIASERHRHKTGEWPASIAAIDRNILPTAPLDPFTGQPFRMARRAGQFVIYSVGPNLDDEQGAQSKNRNMRGGPDDLPARTWDVRLRARKR